MDFRPTSKQQIPFSEITEKENLHAIAEKARLHEWLDFVAPRIQGESQG
jgi:hypothetical protein